MFNLKCSEREAAALNWPEKLFFQTHTKVHRKLDFHCVCFLADGQQIWFYSTSECQAYGAMLEMFFELQLLLQNVLVFH